MQFFAAFINLRVWPQGAHLVRWKRLCRLKLLFGTLRTKNIMTEFCGTYTLIESININPFTSATFPGKVWNFEFSENYRPGQPKVGFLTVDIPQITVWKFGNFHANFVWNQFWLILEGQNLQYQQFWRFWIMIFEISCLKMTKVFKNSKFWVTQTVKMAVFRASN